MVLFGTIINGIGIIVGSLLGIKFKAIPERVKETVMQSIGLVVLLIGLQMALAMESIVIVLVSILLGAIIGEWLQIEYRIQQFGTYIGSLFRSNDDTTFSFAEGFIAASLLSAVGAMAILGPLESGMRNDHEILLSKAAIDGFTSLVLTSTLGIGVLFSFIPVVLYQGTIALLATQIDRIIPPMYMDGLMTQITAVGGILIIAIGLNLLKITHIRIANLLPSIVIVGLIYGISVWI